MASIRKHITREVVSLEAGAPIRDAARLMSSRKIGSVGVKEDGKLVGLVTERDLVLTVLAGELSATGPSAGRCGRGSRGSRRTRARPTAQR